MDSETRKNYITWQNHAFRFYIGARLLLLNEQYSPAAFCGFQAIESLMKGTLVYWDKSFRPKSAGHNMEKMIQTVKNKVDGAKLFECPEYFYSDHRYQAVTRYPVEGKGVLVPASFLNDIDNMFCTLVKFVPFQFNSQLIRALRGKNKYNLVILRRRNSEIRSLRNALNMNIEKKA